MVHAQEVDGFAAAFAKAAPSFDTPLSPGEETQFQTWKAKYAPRDSGEDYDLRGAFKAGLQPDPQTGHWPDTFKKPNHPTFSDESQYAAAGNPGHWEGETFVPAKARAEPRKPADDFEAAFNRAAAPKMSDRPDNTRTLDLGETATRTGQVMKHGWQSIAAGIPGTIEAIQHAGEAIQAGEFGDSASTGYGTNAQDDLGAKMRPEPLPPAVGPSQEAGDVFGAVGTWGPIAALAPIAAVPLAATTTMADHFRDLTEKGIAPDQALAVAGAHGAVDATTFALLPVWARVKFGQPAVEELMHAAMTGGTFAAAQIAKNMVDKTTDPELDVFTGAKGALGQGLLLHAVMAMVGNAVAQIPKGTNEKTAPSGSDQGAMSAPEESASAGMPSVPSEAQGAAQEAPSAGGADQGAGSAVPSSGEIAVADAGAGGSDQVGSAAQEPVGAGPAGAERPASDVGTGETTTPQVEPARPPVSEGEPGLSETPTSNEGESSKTTSIKNAVVEKELASMGFDPPEKDKTTFAEQYTKAKSKFDADPYAGQKLVDDLASNERPPTKEENALLALEANRLINARDEAAQAVIDAPDEASRAEAKLREAKAQDDYMRAATVFERVGTEASGSLNFRRMMIARDYSLAAMERREMVDIASGPPISDAERGARMSEIKDLHDRIHSTQAAFDEYVKKAEADRADLASRLATERLKREVRTRAPAKEKPVREYISKKAEEAKDFYRKGGTMLRGGLNPIGLEDVSRLAYVAADYTIKGLDAGTELVKAFGERIKPHLDAILSRAREVANVDKPLGQIEEKLKGEDADLGSIRPQVLKIARHIVAENPDIEREGLAGRVHEILKPIVPEITHEQTRDLISGYGDFKQLSKDQISARLRDLKGQMQQVAKLEAMTERGEAPLKTGMERREPTAEERKLIKEVNDTKRRLGINPTDQETQLKSTLQSLKTRWTNQIADLTAKLEAGDFEKRPPKPPTVLDPEALRLKAEKEGVVKEYKNRARKAELANRTKFEKGADLLVSVERGIKLTSGGTLGKLAVGGATRLATTPAEELVGGFLGRIPGYKGIFDRAPREGGASVDALARGYGNMWKNTLTQAAKKLKTGKWDFEIAHGDGAPEAPEFVGFFGRLHGLLKTPEALNEFGLSAAKREAWVAKNMRDPMNPLLQMGIGADAARDANAAVFNQDNRVTQTWNDVLRKAETPSKTTGRPTILGKTGATVGRLEIPFAKVPVNIVGEALTNAFGLVTGNIKAAEVIRSGVENLKPEEADQIARHLKKGALGAAVLLLGFYNHKNVGGFYTPGKRQGDDTKFGEAKVGGVTLPKWALAMPLMLVYQLGGTIGRIADSKLRRADTDTQGVGMGTIAGTLGLLEEVPLIREPVDAVESLTDPYKREGFIGRHLAGDIIPSGVSWIARQTDTDAKGDPIERKAKTIGENIQAAIPGQRQKLPVKQ